MGYPYDLRVSAGESGASSLKKVQSYLMIPSEGKLAIDPTPWISRNMPVAQSIYDAQKKAWRLLETRPCTTAQLLDFLKQSGRIRLSSIRLLDRECDEKIASEALSRAEKVEFRKVKNWISAKGKSAAGEFKTQRDRAVAAALAPLLHQGYGAFVKASRKEKCICTEPGLFLKQLNQLLEFHEKNEHACKPQCVNMKQHLGRWLRYAFTNSFPNRHTVLLWTGAPETGKSTVIQAILNGMGGVFRKLCVFSPSFSDGGFMYSGYDPDTCVILNLNDLRLGDCNVSTTLKVLEANEDTKLAQKGVDAITFGEDKMVVCSTNNLGAPAYDDAFTWSPADVKAFLTRCWMGGSEGMQWWCPLPGAFTESASQNARQCRCSRCSAEFLEECVECVQCA
jgi:hypothetical protein